MKYIIIAILFIPALCSHSTHDSEYLETEKQVACLARNIYHEARGEGRAGMIAVATVTVNRVKTKGFPSDVCKVVYQPYQFSWTVKDKDKKIGENYLTAYNVAHQVIVEEKTHQTLDEQNALYYHTNKVNPSWAKRLKLVTVIGKHKFYAKPRKNQSV